MHQHSNSTVEIPDIDTSVDTENGIPIGGRNKPAYSVSVQLMMMIPNSVLEDPTDEGDWLFLVFFFFFFFFFFTDRPSYAT